MGGTPPDGFLEAYEVMQAAQSKQCDSTKPGVTAESVDRIGLELIAAAGYGDMFIHRTCHGPTSTRAADSFGP
jgi:Xaa-Pro aminopeptidase